MGWERWLEWGSYRLSLTSRSDSRILPQQCAPKLIAIGVMTAGYVYAESYYKGIKLPRRDCRRDAVVSAGAKLKSAANDGDEYFSFYAP